MLSRVQDVEDCRNRFPTKVWILNVSFDLPYSIFRRVESYPLRQLLFLRSNSCRIRRRSRSRYFVFIWLVIDLYVKEKNQIFPRGQSRLLLRVVSGLAMCVAVNTLYPIELYVSRWTRTVP